MRVQRGTFITKSKGLLIEIFVGINGWKRTSIRKEFLELNGGI